MRTRTNKHIGELYNNHDFEKIIEYASNEIKNDPDNADIYNDRGVTYATLRKYELALADYNKAILIKSDCDQYYINRAYVFYVFGSYVSAIKDCDKAIQIKPDRSLSYFTRGRAYLDGYQLYKDYDFKQAIQDFNEADRIRMLENTGNPRDYIDDYRDYIDYFRKYAHYINGIKNHNIQAILDHEINYNTWSFNWKFNQRNKKNALTRLDIQDLPYIASYNLRQKIVEQAYEADPTLNRRKTLENAIKLHDIIFKYYINLKQLDVLRSMNETVRVWLTQTWRQLVTKKDLDGNPVAIINSLDLPSEIWQHITTFIIAHEDAKKIRDVTSEKLRDDIKTEFSLGTGETMVNAVRHGLSFFGIQTAANIRKKAELEHTAEPRHQDRVNF